MSAKKTKIAAKKVTKSIKKIATKTAKKTKPIVKKTKKAVKKLVKIVKKEIKKPTKKQVKKPAKKAVKEIKKLPKKIEKKIKKISKKTTKPTKELKKPTKEKTIKKESLASKILAKGKKKNEEKQSKEVPTIQEKIVIKRTDNKSKLSFKIGQYAIYPSHGVGKIIDIESTNILGTELKFYLMNFEKERLTIKIPVNNAEKVGLRHLISKQEMDEVFHILRSGVKKLKGMWSRRAQEYETKINSGDITLLAEVLRDLTRDIEDSERSYSERIIYETAIYRLASEYAVIYGISFEEAKDKIIIVAKDKLDSEIKVRKDDFDDFDDFEKDEENEDEEEEEEEEEDDDFDYDFDDFDDDEPRKKRKK